MVRWGHCHVFIFYMLTGVCLIVFCDISGLGGGMSSTGRYF